ncbi:MAG: hypothetical protein ACRD11_03955 [Terriglobia bacterium]
MKAKVTLALLVPAILIVAYAVRRTLACSPGAFTPIPIFINILHPDLPITDFGAGNVGVIQPDYASIYLYVAYRNLTGEPLNAADEAAVWDDD